jgi:hypothetical protein
LRFSLCNLRAVSCLLLCLAGGIFSSWSGLAEVHLTDEAGGFSGQRFAAALSELADQNSDGRHEFLVGAPLDTENGLESGAVFYYRSREDNRHGLQQVWHGQPGEWFGYAVARIGDVNDDGREDFAVGAPEYDGGGANQGRVYIFYGDTSISSSPDLTISGDAAGDYFGFAISAAGDFNGDGKDDFIVGAPLKNAPGMESGAAYVIYGASGGPSNDLADALMLSGENAGDHFGHSVTDAGNFLGSNSDCVAVGAPGNTQDGIDAGAAYVFAGEQFPADPDADHDLKIRNGAAARPGSLYGFAVEGIGRWDGDGYDDLAIGAPYCNESGSEAGRVEIVFGDPSPSTTGDRYANGEAATDHFGYSLARLGQVEGSGLEDLLIGAPGHDGTASDAGRAYIFAGGSSSTNDAGNLTVLDAAPLNAGTMAQDHFGVAVASAGFFDDDEIPDYAVGADAGNIGNTASAGYCWVDDSSGQLVANLLSLWNADWDDEGGIRLSFAFSLPAQRIVRISLHRSVPGGPAQLVWSGPVPGPDAQQGPVLTPEGFTFSDGSAPAGPQLTYTLTLAKSDGTEVVLSALNGPDPDLRPVLAAHLEPVWPNPFNPAVTISFDLPAGRQGHLQVLDMRGRVVAELFSGPGRGAGQTATWNGQTLQGRPAPSGVYLFRLQTGNEVLTRRAVLAK